MEIRVCEAYVNISSFFVPLSISKRVTVPREGDVIVHLQTLGITFCFVE